MAYCVFHQWLQHEIRNQGIKRIGCYVDLHAETVGKTNFLYIQIELDEFHFFFESHLLFACALKSVAQKTAQTGNHVYSLPLFVGSDQSRNSMKSVEEEMRMQLHF